MPDIILEAIGLTKRYGKRLAVDNLDFSVGRGEIYGFLGRNGSGKSTTIRMILGLVWPTAGEVRISGVRVRAGRSQKSWRVGAIVESPQFYEYLSARQNLELLTSLSGGASEFQIDSSLELVGLRHRCDEPVSNFSHGMRQRLGLAQALLPDPELVILDEPLDGLDPPGIRQMRDIMRDVVADGNVSIVYSSHILAEVEMTCDRILMISEGKRIYEGTTGELLTQNAGVRLRTRPEAAPDEILREAPYIESASRDGDRWTLAMDADRVPELNKALVEGGVDVLELAPIKRTLEDVFLTLTSAAERPPGEMPPTSPKSPPKGPAGRELSKTR